jgi:hypothetical protein
VGAESNTTVTDRAPNRTVPSPARRGGGPMSWTSSVAPATPAADDDDRGEPRLRQLMGVCGWAAVLGGIGLVIGIRGFIGVLAGDSAGWFEPTMMVVGVLGIGLTVSAFLTVQRNRVPWILLGAASLVLVAAMIITGQAF